jgi:hypothetical protein
MKNEKLSRTFLLGACLLTLSLASHATGLFRAYLASTGNDANLCTVNAPCRLLPAALAAVTDGGEVWMLDSANYNTSTVAIAKSVTILAVPGAVGSLVATGAGPAISVGGTGANVVLRNLVIVPLAGGSPGTWGAIVDAPNQLTLENTIVSGNVSGGVLSQGGRLRILNSVIRDNQGDGVLASGGTAYIVSSRIQGNAGVGAEMDAAPAPGVVGVVTDTVVSGNGSGLVTLGFNPGDTSRVSVTRSVFANNTGQGIGVFDESSGLPGDLVLSIGNSAITDNGTVGWNQGGAGAVLETPQNNVIQNPLNGSGTSTLLILQ